MYHNHVESVDLEGACIISVCPCVYWFEPPHAAIMLYSLHAAGPSVYIHRPSSWYLSKSQSTQSTQAAIKQSFIGIQDLKSCSNMH